MPPRKECRPRHEIILYSFLPPSMTDVNPQPTQDVTTTMRPIYEVSYQCLVDIRRVSLLFDVSKLDRARTLYVPDFDRNHLLHFPHFLNNIRQISTMMIPVRIRVKITPETSSLRPSMRSLDQPAKSCNQLRASTLSSFSKSGEGFAFPDLIKFPFTAFWKTCVAIYVLVEYPLWRHDYGIYVRCYMKSLIKNRRAPLRSMTWTDPWNKPSKFLASEVHPIQLDNIARATLL